MLPLSLCVSPNGANKRSLNRGGAGPQALQYIEDLHWHVRLRVLVLKTFDFLWRLRIRRPTPLEDRRKTN